MHAESTPAVANASLLDAALMIQERVMALRGKVRELCFAVALFQKECQLCHTTRLVMIRDSWCRCQACSHEFDPTLQFQACGACDSRLLKKVYHYWCPVCRQAVRSQYCFDARVFDAAYFREMMRKSRERKAASREEIKELLANSRSEPVIPVANNSGMMESFLQDLDAFNAQVAVHLPASAVAARPAYNMAIYREHIRELVAGCVVNFEGISALSADRRMDRIFRFITVIFMEQDGLLHIEQDFEGRITLCGT